MGQSSSIPMLQYIALLLDFLILVFLGYLLDIPRSGQSMTGRHSAMILGSTLIVRIGELIRVFVKLINNSLPPFHSVWQVVSYLSPNRSTGLGYLG